MTTTTIKPVDELDFDDTFSFPDDEDRNLYVLTGTQWIANSVLPVQLIYIEVGAPANEVNRTQHACDELVEVWT